MAERQGLTLSRSRRRDRLALDYGLYWLTSPDGGAVTPAGGCTMDEVERYLTTPR